MLTLDKKLQANDLAIRDRAFVSRTQCLGSVERDKEDIMQTRNLCLGVACLLQLLVFFFLFSTPFYPFNPITLHKREKGMEGKERDP